MRCYASPDSMRSAQMKMRRASQLSALPKSDQSGCDSGPWEDRTAGSKEEGYFSSCLRRAASW
jgi:hypothetical protein